MKKDFLILYELKNRELENAALIATELRNRGYTVDICYINSKKYFTEYEVIITPNLANDQDVYYVLKSAKKMANKLILMKQEQALSENGENSGWGIPVESAKKSHMIAWGDSMQDRLIEAGIEAERIHKIGSVALDFNHNSFDAYYHSRDFIMKQYRIEKNKHIHLFISSFSHCNLETYYIEQLRLIDNGTDRQIEIAEKSQKELLRWFEDLVSTREDILCIYRPHPAERIGDSLKTIAKKYDNFIINKDYSIRQWIRVVDSISLWYSTCIADIAYQHKNCLVLRPYEYPKDLDEVVLIDSIKITNRIDFINSIDDFNSKPFPVDKNIIHYYFGNKFDGKSYKRMADVCEKVFSSRDEINYMKMAKVGYIYKLKVPIIKMIGKINEIIDLSTLMPSKYKDYFHRLYKEEKDYIKEFDLYCDRLKEAGF